MVAATGLFAGLEKHILEHGTKVDGDVDFSELSLIGEGTDRVIAFQLLGGNFLLTPEEEVVSVDGVDGEAETYALDEGLKKAVHSFLRWRIAFADAFSI